MLFFPQWEPRLWSRREPDWTCSNIRCCVNMCEPVSMQTTCCNYRSKDREVMSVIIIKDYSKADANNRTMTSAVSAFTLNYNSWLFWHKQAPHDKRLLHTRPHLMKYWDIINSAQESFTFVIFTQLIYICKEMEGVQSPFYFNVKAKYVLGLEQHTHLNIICNSRSESLTLVPWDHSWTLQRLHRKSELLQAH